MISVGASNVKAVYGWWGHLPDQPFRLLAYMALVAKDDDSAPRFWAGRESLAIGLGRVAPHDETDFRAVNRALHKLRRAGAIELDQHSGPGRRANYLIHLQPRSQDTKRPLNTGHLVTEPQDTRRPERGTSSDQTGDTDRPPKEPQEPQGFAQGRTAHPSPEPQGSAQERCRCGNDRFTVEGDCTACGEARAA